MWIWLGWFAAALQDWSQPDRELLGELLGRFVDDLSAHLAAHYGVYAAGDGDRGPLS